MCLFLQTRAFATITVPKVGTEGQGHSEAFPNQVAVANISRKTRVLLATSDGYLYIYDLPGETSISTSEWYQQLEKKLFS